MKDWRKLPLSFPFEPIRECAKWPGPGWQSFQEGAERFDPEGTFGVRLLDQIVPAIHMPDGIRAVEKDFRPASADSVWRYLASKFKSDLDRVRAAMQTLAASLSPEELNRRGFALYEEFRPEVPAGAQGWGAAGILDLDRIVALARG